MNAAAADLRTLVLWAGGLSAAAGVLHGAVVEEHLAEWWGYGLFFILSALGQGAYGLALLYQGLSDADLRPRLEAWRPFLLAGIAGNLAIIVLYFVTRTVGIPLFGPEAGEVEPVTPISLFVMLLEAALVVALFLTVRRLAVSPRATPQGGTA